MGGRGHRFQRVVHGRASLDEPIKKKESYMALLGENGAPINLEGKTKGTYPITYKKESTHSHWDQKLSKKNDRKQGPQNGGGFRSANPHGAASLFRGGEAREHRDCGGTKGRPCGFQRGVGKTPAVGKTLPPSEGKGKYKAERPWVPSVLKSKNLVARSQHGTVSDHKNPYLEEGQGRTRGKGGAGGGGGRPAREEIKNAFRKNLRRDEIIRGDKFVR